MRQRTPGKPDRRPQAAFARHRPRQRGTTALELVMVAVLLTIMVARFIENQVEAEGRQRAEIAASRMKQIVRAVDEFTETRFQAIRASIADAGGPIAVPVATDSANPGTVWPTVATDDPDELAPAMTVQNTGMLPESFNPLNAWRQREWVVYRSISGGSVSAMVVSVGGDAMAPDMVELIAANVGAAGGMILDKIPHNPNRIEGVYGGWTSDRANWDTPAPITLTSGHVAATLAIARNGLHQGFLYRTDVPDDDDELNSMRTSLRMCELDTDGLCADTDNDGEIRDEPQDITHVRDIIFARTAVSETAHGQRQFEASPDPAAAVPQRVSEAVYTMGTAEDGAIVRMPGCPDGTEAKITTTVSAMASARSEDIQSFETWAEPLDDQGGDGIEDSWQVRAQVTTSSGPEMGPGGPHAITYFTKCEGT